MSLKKWDPAAPLVPGVTLLEASAGTGKTWNIANLVLRLIVEKGTPIDRILVVTFTRAATAELKERIRRRIADGLAVVEGRLATEEEALLAVGRRAAAESDPVTWRRLRAAQESFDACLVSTIHGFCQRMLELHAFESGADFGLELMSDLSEVQEAAVTDLLTRERWVGDTERYTFLTEQAGCTPKQIRELAKAALSERDMPVEPSGELLTEQGWREGVARVAKRWREVAPGLPLAVQHAKDSGVLKPRQKTFKPDIAEALLKTVDTWLENPGLGSAPDPGNWVVAAKLKSSSADPNNLFHHEAIDCLVEWMELSCQLASGMRAQWVHDLRRDVAAQLEQRRALSYDDLLRGLALRLGPTADPQERQTLAAAIGQRYDAALIDEFQDTDLHQWTIFRQVFGHGDHYLYLIGDPKQAIYGFRGANIQVYLEAAAHSSSQRFTMTRNWRSDERFVQACGALLGRPGIFDQPGIEYVHVDTPPRNPADLIVPPAGFGEPEAAPLQVRWFDGDSAGLSNDSLPPKGSMVALVTAVLADDVVQLLDSGTLLVDKPNRPVRPGDIAVLVRTGRQAKQVQEALMAAGVPAVRAGKDSVLVSEASRDLLQWLLLLASPRRESLQRAAAVTRLVGLTADVLVGIDTEEREDLERWDDWLARVERQARHAREVGVMAALRQALFDHSAHERLLSELGGERYLTDLLHVAELAHEAQQAQRLQIEGVAAWLVDERDRATDASDEAQLRLESDAEAVQILTVHGSKGLEFPVVFVPFDWTQRQDKTPALQPLIAPDPINPARRVLDVRVPGADGSTSAAVRSRALERVRQAESQERMRLLYVALTRAQHRLVLYAGYAAEADRTAVLDALVGSTEEPEQLTELWSEGAGALLAELQRREQRWNRDAEEPLIAVRVCEPPQGLRWQGSEQPCSSELSVRRFERSALDTAWSRHSYSGLVRRRHQLTARSHDVVNPKDHDGLVGVVVEAQEPPTPMPSTDEQPVPLAEFPAGAQAGTALHEVLELLDFQVAHPDSGPDDKAIEAIAAVAREQLPRNSIGGEEAVEVLAKGLLVALRTPLGGPAGSLRLCDLSRADRLDELRFDLPVAGGSRAGSPGWEQPVEPEALLEALEGGGALSPTSWLKELRARPVPPLSGFLTGSIDLIFRDPEGRIHIADYKSNRLVGPRAPMVPSVFQPAALAAEMHAHDYYLQAHLYLLATHRFMRSRLGNTWDPSTMLGGVYYLFMRGMVGDVPGAGCFSATPALEALHRLDALFHNPGLQEAS